jgi:hypothetical protein
MPDPEPRDIVLDALRDLLASEGEPPDGSESDGCAGGGDEEAGKAVGDVTAGPV